jgi:hypothetical protein
LTRVRDEPAAQDGNFFATTEEIPITNYSLAGSGARRTIGADVEWTFPLSFVEVVWGDGKKVDRQIVSATHLGAFGTKRFAIPFDATGKSWVRFRRVGYGRQRCVRAARLGEHAADDHGLSMRCRKDPDRFTAPPS